MAFFSFTFLRVAVADLFDVTNSHPPRFFCHPSNSFVSRLPLSLTLCFFSFSKAWSPLYVFSCSMALFSIMVPQATVTFCSKPMVSLTLGPVFFYPCFFAPCLTVLRPGSCICFLIGFVFSRTPLFANPFSNPLLFFDPCFCLPHKFKG